ncbi:hypothetical protein [Kitasatospora sp. NPDC093679]|uniref:hypothetical protein n=1 Tax=Kitasatospora sp. NPDC093679 TaxID=3154983 RepID=UPI0034149789
MTLTTAAIASSLHLARAVAAHLPSRPGRTWTARPEEHIVLAGLPAVPTASVSDGHRELLVAAGVGRAVLATMPRRGRGAEVLARSGRAAQPEFLANDAVRQLLPRLDDQAAERLSPAERQAAAEALTRDLRAVPPGRIVAQGTSHLALQIAETVVMTGVDPASLRAGLVTNQMRLPFVERVLRLALASPGATTHRPLGDDIRARAARRLASAFPGATASHPGRTSVLLWENGPVRCEVRADETGSGSDAAAVELALFGGVDLILAALDRLR